MAKCVSGSRGPSRRGVWSVGTLVLVAGLAACSGESTTDTALDPAQVVGEYGQAGRFDCLNLTPDGRYECWVTNGITVDGCGTFVGSGLSEGSWSCRGAAVEFTPLKEPHDLVVSFDGTHGTLSDGALLLTIEGQPFRFPRLER